MAAKKCLFAMYKGDDYITEGTIEQLAAFRGVKEKTIRYYATQRYQNRNKGKNSTCLINLGYIEELEGF